jgi:hypothetical protein
VRATYLSQRYERASEPGERLVRSDEPATQALTWLDLSYYDLKQYPDCIRVCEHMLDLGLTQEAVYYYESRAWTKLKEYRKSDSLLQNYDTAYYLFRDPTVLYTCGRICEVEMKDLGRAKRYYLRYLEVAQPKTAAERQALAYVRKRWGRKQTPKP